MKKTITLLMTYLLVNFTLLSGTIIETAHFSEINPYITPKTLVILDIDDTLLVPVQTLGTDVWFLYRMKQYQDSGLSHADALEKTIAEWEAIRHLTQIKVVEKGTEKIIADLQNKNVTIMGLTTQGIALATRTLQQLQSLDIDLSKTAPSQEDHYFINRHAVLYRNGILFTSGTPKGPALLKLLDLMDYHPEHIIFINDKDAHLADVEKAVERRGINFTGLRYSYSDERVASFRPEIAEVQWIFSSFDHILSDEEADQILQMCK